jgi:hypothetical protein
MKAAAVKEKENLPLVVCTTLSRLLELLLDSLKGFHERPSGCWGRETILGKLTIFCPKRLRRLIFFLHSFGVA